METPKKVKELAEGGDVEYKGKNGSGKEIYYVKPSMEGAIEGFPVFIQYDRKKDEASFDNSPELINLI